MFNLQINIQINILPIIQSGLVIQLHLLCAMLALVLGGVMWFRPKGTVGHKMVGRGFMVVMVLTAFSAFFIREVADGKMSFIHVFIPISLFSVFQAVRYIRNGNVSGHKRAVKGLYFLALMIPGLFALLPGRLLHAVLMGG